jgi:hypothetical protein
MTSKEMVMEAVRTLPDDAPIEEAMERLLVLAKIEKESGRRTQGKPCLTTK